MLYGSGAAKVFRYPGRVSVAAVARARLQPEVKGVDTTLTLNPIISTTTTNASSFLLNAIAPGSGSFNRIGRKAHLKSLRLKGAITFTAVASATGVNFGNWVRMVVVWDQQPNSGSIPTWDTIFGVTDQAGTETSTILAPLKYDNMNRFQILKDRTIDYDVQAAAPVSTGSTSELVLFDEYLTLGNRETLYSGQSATCTTADISSGALYVYFRAYTNTAGVNVAQVDGTSIARLRYCD